MKFFWRYVNPFLALAVMAICFLAATGEKGGNLAFFQDAFSTYFLAKGIFCATALFLLGKLVEHAVFTDQNSPHSERRNGAAGSNRPEA